MSGIVAGIRHNSSAWNHFEGRRVLGAKSTRQRRRARRRPDDQRDTSDRCGCGGARTQGQGHVHAGRARSRGRVPFRDGSCDGPPARLHRHRAGRCPGRGHPIVRRRRLLLRSGGSAPWRACRRSRQRLGDGQLHRRAQSRTERTGDGHRHDRRAAGESRATQRRSRLSRPSDSARRSSMRRGCQTDRAMPSSAMA